jgi:hypothetical protein
MLLQELLCLTDSYADIEPWFTDIAQYLLNNFHLSINNEPHRIIEIECYYYSPTHQDVFAHRDAIQLNCARWYFHKIGGTYKGGTFKGLDLTFGDSNSYGGILIRTVETPGGSIICGPSLCVDYLLSKCDSKNITMLDDKIAQRTAFDNSNILRLSTSPICGQNKIFTTARVGLSLKKATSTNNMQSFLLRPYRYLTEPRKITKGKVHLILALHRSGINIEEICQTTGSPRRSVQRYIDEFKIGQQEQNFGAYFGRELDSFALCRLHGNICMGQ